jgi:lipopolysaccharide export system permease protein
VGKIIGRYVLREVLSAWLLMMAVLLIILTAYEVGAVLERAAASQFPQGVITRLIYLGLLQYVSLVAPMALLLGIIWAFGRLYHDSEMAAALACGVRPGVLYRPVIALAVVVAAGLAAVTLVLAPRATFQALTLRDKAIRAGQFAPLEPGQFRSFGGGSAVVYAQRVEPNGALGNVFIERTRGRTVEVAVANQARHTVSPDGTSQTIELYHGERFEGVPGSAQFRIMRFAEHTVPIPMPPANQLVTDLDAAPTAALYASTDLRQQAKLQWRIALPLMCLVLAVVALPLSRLRPRQGRYARVWVALVLYVVYLNLLTAGEAWLGHGQIPPLLGLWWVHVVVILLAVAMMRGPELASRMRIFGARA